MCATNSRQWSTIWAAVKPLAGSPRRPHSLFQLWRGQRRIADALRRNRLGRSHTAGQPVGTFSRTGGTGRRPPARPARSNQARVKKAVRELDRGRLLRHSARSGRSTDGRHLSAEELVRQYGTKIAQIVRGEETPLSASERQEVLASSMSYYPDDLLVVGWVAAFVYDTPFAAAAHYRSARVRQHPVLEFRYYDEVLTRVLAMSIGAWKSAAASLGAMDSRPPRRRTQYHPARIIASLLSGPITPSSFSATCSMRALIDWPPPA